MKKKSILFPICLHMWEFFCGFKGKLHSNNRSRHCQDKKTKRLTGSYILVKKIDTKTASPSSCFG